MRSTFKITFYVNRNKEKNGQVPVLGRITINGSIAQFSCKQSINPELWDARSNRATGKSDQALKVNRALDNIRVQITKHYQLLSDRKSYVTAEMVRNAWQGIGSEADTLLASFDKYNKEFSTRVGKDRAQSTYEKYLVARRHLASFVKISYRRNDIALKEITSEFIERYSIYLGITLGLSSSTVWLYCLPLKMLITKAHNNGIISSNPFADHHLQVKVKERGYLTEKELGILMNHKFTNPRLELVRDAFVFASLTGLSYVDIRNLTADMIVTMPDGSKWINSSRKKTKTPFSVKLLDTPIRILEKYDHGRPGEVILPIPRNDVANERLKAIAKKSGLERHLTFHMARRKNTCLLLIESRLQSCYAESITV